jgi:hypothetical protein
LNKDGSIMAWGNSDSGGTDAPVNGSYAKIYANNHAFAGVTI